jgi:hypothetical protein
MSIADGTPLMQRIAANMTTEAYWISAWCQANAKGDAVKIMCYWDATNEVLRKAVAKLVPELPVEGIYPLLKFDSGDFR